MSSPHAPRTPTAVSLNDAPRSVSLDQDSGLGLGLDLRPRVSQTTASSSSIANDADAHLPRTSSSSSVSPSPLVHFRSHTIAPSPPPQHDELPPHHDSLLAPDKHTLGSDRVASSPVGGLRITTDFTTTPVTPVRRESFNNNGNAFSNPRAALASLNHKSSTGSLRPISRTPSLKTALANSIGSASGTSSVVPSPIISAMGEVTPLPSPLMSGDSPGPWKRLSTGSASPPQSRSRLSGEQSVLVSSTGESIDAALAHGPKRKMYTSLEPGETPSAQSAHHGTHGRHRSTSEYIPEPAGVPKRQITVSGSHAKIDLSEAPLEAHMRRELNYAESRGLTPSVTEPPTPPPSESSRDSADGSSRPKSSRAEFFEAHGRQDRKRRRWRAIRLLGQGTFSRVMLATSQTDVEDDAPEAESGLLTPKPELALERKTLVAVKVCEHGPRGGASEERVEMSLKRELEIMQTIHHPSLVDLKAWSIEPTRAILVLSYCPGGDLFDVATAHRDVLKPPLLRRIFSELIGAVSYLHERRIVHRDIKLENVLVNLTANELADPSTDWTTYPYSVITLTDLGLSRRIADDEKLETRCGSDDYAAPEVIMGQPYDGRATDAWSLGVLLYALLEARLPFDPHPGMSDAHRMRSRTSHRIARVEWRWVEYAGDDGDHEGDEAKFKEQGLFGAMEITEGLLKRARSRWSVEKVVKQPWVADAMTIDGGLRFREEAEGQEVS